MHFDASRLFRQIQGLGFRDGSCECDFPKGSAAARVGYARSREAKNGDGYQARSK